MTSTSFIVMRLTGERVIDHYTAANFSPLYDVGAAGLGRRTSTTSSGRSGCRG